MLTQHKTYGGEFSPPHRIIVGMIDSGASVLEVGCGLGGLTQALRNDLGCRVTAVELDERLACVAQEFTDKMIVGSIESNDTWNQIEGSFDYVIFADVLEHLVNPWDVLRRVRGVLADNGSVIISIPNIAFYRVRLKLLLGRFDYAPLGILDDTHLRFFTLKTAKAMLAETGFRMTDFSTTTWGTIAQMGMRRFPGIFAYEFIMKAVID